MNNLDQLRQNHPWPATRPEVPTDMENGWFHGENRNVIETILPRARVVLELGAWLGMSARWMADRFSGTVITIDHWEGSREHGNMSELNSLWDTFCTNCWGHRDRIIPVKLKTIAGMREVHSLGIKPELIYVDASHEANDVAGDLNLILELFPSAHIVGDDWCWTSVRQGVFQVVEPPTFTRHMVTRTACYEIFPADARAYHP